ncbi:hypothetical protein Acy02nite_73770 [Actinoplanes cyaneus]|uniref:Heavy metal-binding domain-containing protein n=1 Tax=Actinoplanes cyaneus TaxID=52696 RepID=A0A919IQS7_9ACTN|nr:hypothetical protein Acy02nite_73770 [Actinoplanes cyaneus]
MRLMTYALGLVVVFASAAGAGRAFGPEGKPAPAPAHTAMDEHPGHEATTVAAEGLQVTQAGYTLSPLTTRLVAGQAQTFAFRIVGPDGRAVTQFTREHGTEEHGTELHLIVVRRDMAGYQHLHPVRAADGTWSVPLTVSEPGAYRALADFTPRARTEGLVLGADLDAPGDYQPRLLPKPDWETTADGYTVTRAGEPQAGADSWMTVSVSRNGQPVTLEPYLGSFGHLVALHQGDLAYLHLHPQEGATAGPDVTVDASVAATGTYRLFLEFKHDGTVHLAEFTATTGAGHTHN